MVENPRTFMEQNFNFCILNLKQLESGLKLPFGHIFAPFIQPPFELTSTRTIIFCEKYVFKGYLSDSRIYF